MRLNELFHGMMQCPACGTAIDAPDYVCGKCGKRYLTEDGLLDFLDVALKENADRDRISDPENSLKNFFKKWPGFYRAISLLISPILFTGLTIEKFIRNNFGKGSVLNVGSGPTKVHENVVNLDLYPFTNVDVLAAAEKLPFRDGVFDVVCSDQVLEHVRDPKRVVAEMLRVVKDGGLVYAGTPFIFPWHPSPRDYSRWSKEGLAELFVGHKIVDSGVTIGPTSALLTVLSTWLSIVFSFGIAPLRKTLNYLFMVSCFPFKFLDLAFAHFPGAEITAAAVYVVAKKSPADKD